MALPLHGCDSLMSFLAPGTFLWERALPCPLVHITNTLAQQRKLQPTQAAGLGALCLPHHSGHSPQRLHLKAWPSHPGSARLGVGDTV